MPGRQGGVLALDLASTVGWAFGHPNDLDPLFGCWHLPRFGGEGGRYAAFENELAAFMAEHEPSYMVLEAAFSLQAFAASSTIAVARQQLSLRAIAYMEAYRASVPISEIDSDSVRFAILGRARFPKDTVKREVIAYCRRRTWKVPDHNAGDACLTWLWYVGQVNGTRPVAGPLFQEGRTLQ